MSAIQHPSLFDVNYGRELRDKGVHAVELAEWRDDHDLLDRVILRFADGGRLFSSDDVWPYLPKGIKRNSVGAAFLRAAKAGYIVEVDWKHSARPAARSRKITVWQGSHRGAA